MTDEVENLAVTPVPEQIATAAPESVVETPEARVSRKKNLMLPLENASQESNGSGNEIKRNARQKCRR